MKRAVWFDLDNSPHVPLLVPVIKSLRQQGVEVVVTARDHSQTVDLLEIHSMARSYEVIGRHYGKGRFSKVCGLLIRTIQLASHIRKLRRRGICASVAVSHGSRPLVMAAAFLRIPAVSMYDYEHTETAIFNRFSSKVFVPDAIPDEVLRSIGLPRSKTVKYWGLKEQLYISRYEPRPSVRQELEQLLGFDATDILIVFRPPATSANYHDPASEGLAREILGYVSNIENAVVVIIPRTEEQAVEMNKTIVADPMIRSNRIKMLDRVVDGLDLCMAADVVISGGGTMNREAALLNVPVYSIFSGRQGSLDREMERTGKITFIRTVEDIKNIQVTRKETFDLTPQPSDLEEMLIEEIQSQLAQSQ